MVDNNELYHFGVQGQKWGLRRWQNEDGSLTPAGVQHYGRKYSRGISRIKKKEARSAELKTIGAKRQYKADKYALKADRAVTDFGYRRKTRKALKKKRRASRMLWKAEKSNNQAIKIYKNLETKFKDIPMSALNKSDVDYGKKYANKVLY